MTVKNSAFGASGFRNPLITSVHASPSKTGNNTECVRLCSPPAPPFSLIAEENDENVGKTDPTNETEEEAVVTVKVEPETKIAVPVADEFKVHVYPNPSVHEFTLMVNSKSKEPVTIRIMDVNGVVKSVNAMVAKSNNIKVGKNLVAGIYTAEVVQGKNRQLIKLIKLN